jgi:hypothetical protein
LDIHERSKGFELKYKPQIKCMKLKGATVYIDVSKKPEKRRQFFKNADNSSSNESLFSTKLRNQTISPDSP